MKYEITPVAFISSCYKEKFATPRQSGLVDLAQGQVKLCAPFDHPDAVLGLESCSHIWLEFMFHQCIDQGWKHKVRPPRLGGNEKMGVFATRATHRPNGMGLSLVKLESIEINTESKTDKVILHVSGLDLIDGTPVIDIKPYVPYSDMIADAKYPFAQQAPDTLPVTFCALAEKKLAQQAEFKALIKQVLALDPRPAFHAVDNTRVYGAKLNESNVTWRYLTINDQIIIEVLDV